jgi:DNA-binding NarL/FixJ family response regulator
MKKKIRILLVDDHPLVLEGLKGILATIPNAIVVATTGNGNDGLALLREMEIDLAFLDINLPDINGMELCKKISTKYPHVKCIAISTFGERSYVSRMIQNGASAYLLKSATKEEIEMAINKVMVGDFYLSPDLNHQNLSKEPPTGERLVPVITRREKEVLVLIANGMTNPEIAEKLFISVTTVNSHRKSLLEKFEVHNTAQLIQQAGRMELL